MPSDRAAVVDEAHSWIGTPYRAAQRVKGRDGGVDCLTFVVEVFTRCGFDTRYRAGVPYYPQDWHLHRDDERYLAGVLEYAREIPNGADDPPPEPGDIVLFRFGRCFAHGGIVTAWPMIVHAWNGAGVLPADATQALLGGRPRRFFSPFGADDRGQRTDGKPNPSSVFRPPSSDS
jgi:cell wall-associated NlpC family hydrolase